MRKLLLVPAVLAVVVISASPVRAELKIGDEAPPVTFTDWIRGGPVDVAAGKGKNVFLIEFWATWCRPCFKEIPHLTQLQRKYRDDGLIVIGAASPGPNESLTKVKSFVAKRPQGMDFIVAFDATGRTHTSYMLAARQNSIPHAFLIDRTGRLAWHGHPGLPELDGIIDAVIEGNYDTKTAQAEAELAKRLELLFGRLRRFAIRGDWDTFKTTVQQILTIDPKNEAALGAAFYVHVQETHDVAGFRDLIAAHVEAHEDDEQAMLAVAQSLLGIEPLEVRQPDLALRAAAAAYAVNGESGEAAGGYARALYEIGMVDRAIELQSHAVSLAAGAERLRAKEVLDLYERCKELQKAQQ